MMDKKSNFQWLPVWPWEHEFDQFKQKKEKKNTQWSLFFQSPQMKVRRHSKEQSRLCLMLYYLIIYIIPVLGRVQSRIQSNLKKRGEIGKKSLQSFVQWHFLLYQTEVSIKKKKMISVRNHLHSLHTRRWAPWAWFWKKLKSLADTFPYPLWIRKVGEDTAYLCQQTIFCSFMKPACGKNAFIHWMSSDGFFWANFGF